MKTKKNVLIAALALNSVIQLGLGLMVLLNLKAILENQHMTYTDDLNVFATFFGACLLIISCLGFYVIDFVRKDKPQAIFLSKFIGWWLIIASGIVIIAIKRYDLAAMDFARGLFIVVTAYVAGKKSN